MHKLYVKLNDQYEELSAVALIPNLTTVKRLPLFSAIGDYINRYTLKKKSKFTRNNEKTYFSDLYSFLLSNEIYFCDEVTSEVLNKYKALILKRVKPSTVNRHFSTIKNFFNLLFKYEKIPRNPCVLVSLEKIEKPVINLWTGRDFVKVTRAVDQETKAILYFMWRSGVRSCEAVNLKWTDIDWDHLIFYVRSEKNAEVLRICDVTSRISKILHNIQLKGIYVFGGGSKFTSDSLGKKVRKVVLKVCENKHLTVKGLRHTYCTRAFEKNLTNSTVQSLMGHASYKTTENYKHLSRKHLKKSSEML